MSVFRRQNYLICNRPYAYDVTEGRPRVLGVKRGTATCAIAKRMQPAGQPLHAIPPGWPGPAHWLRGWERQCTDACQPCTSGGSRKFTPTPAITITLLSEITIFFFFFFFLGLQISSSQGPLTDWEAESANALCQHNTCAQRDKSWPPTWRRCYGDVTSMHKVYRVCEKGFTIAFGVTDISDADKRLCADHPLQTCFPEQLLGSFVVYQSQMHGNAHQCEKHGLLAEVKTRSS